MKAKGMFVSAILIADAFLVSYAIGFNSRHVAVVDPSLPPISTKSEPKPEIKTPIEAAQAAKSKKAEHKSKATAKKSKKRHPHPK